MPFTYKSLEERFWEKVEKTDGCWIWHGTRSPLGYGRIGVKTDKWKPKAAHRLSYEMHKGLIPEGLSILHSCDNPSCVNPEHLRAGTIAENNKDMILRHRHSKLMQTHCHKGHEFSLVNTRVTKKGRVCKQCYAEYRKEWQRRRVEEKFLSTAPDCEEVPKKARFAYQIYTKVKGVWVNSKIELKSILGLYNWITARYNISLNRYGLMTRMRRNGMFSFGDNNEFKVERTPID